MQPAVALYDRAAGRKVRRPGEVYASDRVAAPEVLELEVRSGALLYVLRADPGGAAVLLYIAVLGYELRLL